MSDMDKALATQLANIEKRSGKSLDELAAIIRASGLAKHGEIRDMLKRDLGLGHGDANTLTHHVLKSDGQSAAAAAGLSTDDVLAGLYTGPKADLRPIHDKLMAEINKFGEFEIAPKKTYVSLRRKKQFAMIGPATKTQVEVGLNVKGLAPAGRLAEQPPNSMCNYKVRLSTVAEVDAALIGWIKQAFESAA
jgi:predicted transport protein